MLNTWKFQGKHSFTGHQEVDLFNYYEFSGRKTPGIFGNGWASYLSKTNICYYPCQIAH